MNELLWVVGRGTGVAALVFLTLSLSLGVLTARHAGTPSTPRFAVAEIHRRASLGAALLLLAHVVTLVFDSRSGLAWSDAVVPFLNDRNGFWYGMGTVALELVAVLVISSLAKKRLPYAVWRGLHWLSYLCWPLAFAHAVGSGTDVGSSWMWLVTGACVAAVAASVASRCLRHQVCRESQRLVPGDGRP